ncbi:MAG: hypothetical protein J6Y16_09335 [Treponema sp.]|nr:hypothetical protein [Treponema sp.]
MKKIVFATIPMQKINAQHYVCTENKAIEYDGYTGFPINAVLAKTLKKGDDVKVVRIVTEGDFTGDNVELQKKELDEINSKIGANIEYVEVTAPFKETSDVVENRFRQIAGTFENDCTILADMTYGPKTLTPVLFFALGFAEKFFSADISHIVYGRIIFNKDKEAEKNTAELYDVTPLYYLNSLTSVMSAPDGKTALERLNKFFAL